MRENPRAGYQASTRAALTFLAVFDTFAKTPIDVPLSATNRFGAHASIITPTKMTFAACGL